MIEVAFTYNFRPGIDEKAYAKFARQVTAMMISAPGFVEFHAHRNLVGSPQVRRTSIWKSMVDWAKLAQDLEFQKLTSEFGTYVTDIDVQFWGPSPISPDPIKPK